MSSTRRHSFRAIGIDVGGTKIAAGIVQFPGGRLLRRQIVASNIRHGGRKTLDEVVNLAQQLADESTEHGHPPRAIGLGICELIDPSGILLSQNCLRWSRLPVQERLGEIAPTLLEADVRAAAIGEALWGAGKPYRSFLYITIGTGISCCLMIDGRPFLGAHGATGTIGSSPLPNLDRLTSKKSSTSLEEFASGPGLVARYNRRHRSTPVDSGPEVFRAAQKGDADAQEIIRSGAFAVGAVVGGLVNLLDPEAVIVGGGLGLRRGLYRNTLITAARQHIWWPGHRHVSIQSAALAADAGIIGAATVAAQIFPTTGRRLSIRVTP